jgi:hypothetical protein
VNNKKQQGEARALPFAAIPMKTGTFIKAYLDGFSKPTELELISMVCQSPSDSPYWMQM